MEEVIDRVNATSSPEELAINFMMRHARCRMALNEWAQENLLQRAPADSRPGTPAGPPEASGSSRPGEVMASEAVPASALAREDSCAARFSRAYVAARHMSAAGRPLITAKRAAA